MSVEAGEDDCGRDDRAEVEEHQVVVVDHVEEVALHVGGRVLVPSHQRQEAHHAAGEPAHANYN